jgi:hypothetical protein
MVAAKVTTAEDLSSAIREQLDACGVDLDSLGCLSPDGSAVKVVCVPADLCSCLDELGRSPRDQVLMVRVDKETLAELDDWVQTEAVKSRSEAAALFIREGLKVRSSELDELKEALDGVAQARARLRDAARSVFGEAESGESEDAG